MAGPAGRARVLVTDPIAEEGLAVLREGAEVDVQRKLPPERLLELIAGADALVVRSETRVTADVIEAGRRLQVIGRAGVGVDNIDVPAATRLGVVVVNSAEGNTMAAAEHAVAMLLSLSRKIPQADASLRRGEWRRSEFMGVEVYNKTLGVIGLGISGARWRGARAVWRCACWPTTRSSPTSGRVRSGCSSSAWRSCCARRTSSPSTQRLPPARAA